MSNAVLISIRPEWCEKIASGEKTIEVRKTKPSAILPLKCYIYCTKPSFPHEDFLVFDAGTNKVKAFYGGGKVIGEFICDEIRRIDIPFPAYWAEIDKSILDGTCLSLTQAHNYLGHRSGYGWKISDLVIYDTPKELSEFKRWNRTEENSPCAHTKWLYEPCETCSDCNVKHPPQSWMFVEELP